MYLIYLEKTLGNVHISTKTERTLRQRGVQFEVLEICKVKAFAYERLSFWRAHYKKSEPKKPKRARVKWWLHPRRAKDLLRRRRARFLGKNNPNYGDKARTDEGRARNRASSVGKKYALGSKRTLAQRAAISDRVRARPKRTVVNANKDTRWFHDPMTGQQKRFRASEAPYGWVLGQDPHRLERTIENTKARNVSRRKHHRPIQRQASQGKVDSRYDCGMQLHDEES